MLCLLNFHQYAVVSHDLLELVSNDIATFIKSHKKLNVERRLQCNSHVFFLNAAWWTCCVLAPFHILHNSRIHILLCIWWRGLKQQETLLQWFFSLILHIWLFSLLEHIHICTLTQERAWLADSMDRVYYRRVNNRQECSSIRDRNQWITHC